MSDLHVWLDGTHIATLTEERGRMRLVHTRDARPSGAPLVSVAMPVGVARYTDALVRPFFQGLLPEGPARAMIAHDLGLAADDDFGLLAALGRDCAGALVVLPAGQAPPSRPTSPPTVLDDAEIERRLRALPTDPLGVTDSVRASLPGVQPKLLLSRVGDAWCEPDLGRPSTHLLKPAIADLRRSVDNEAFCLALATRAGLHAATTTTARFGPLHVLVSERYDRFVDADATWCRLHQEDACQALSIPTGSPRMKYQAYGGPSLHAIAQLLRRWGADPRALLEVLTFHVLVGNADAHGKNISLLHAPDGHIALAPLYDVMCTAIYDGSDGGRKVDTSAAMTVNGRSDIRTFTVDDLVAEARRWQLRAGAARTVIERVVERVAAAIEPTLAELGLMVPDELVTYIADRVRSLR